MTRLLFLLRHARAASGGGAGDDPLSALAPEGRETARSVARLLARLRPDDAPTWTSPAARCRATAAIVAAASPRGPGPAVRPELGESASTDALLGVVSGAPHGTVLVGHQPNLALLAASLAQGGAAHSFARPGWLVALARPDEGDAAPWHPWLALAPEAAEALD